MKASRRLIPIALVGCIAAALVYMMLNALLLAPAGRLNDRAAQLQRDIDYKTSQLRIFAARAGKLESLAAQTFGSDGDQASERVRARLVTLIQRSGLPADGMSLKPVSGARVKDRYAEVGWTLAAKGRLGQAVSLLYLLQAEPYLHRVETVSLAPAGDGSMADLKLRYTTLVLPGTKDRPLAGGEFADAAATGDLAGADRRRYDALVQRDPFRPYQAPPPKPQPQPEAAPPPPPPDASTHMRVVGLPTWDGQGEVQVLDTQGNKMTTCKPGEELGGGMIVMIDYRPLPMPGKEDILSGSRVILAVGQEFWAVELGQMLSQKRRLEPSQLPPGLAAPVAADGAEAASDAAKP